MSCDVGRRYGSDPMLLWLLWLWPAAIARIQPKAGEIQKAQKKKKKKKKGRGRRHTRTSEADHAVEEIPSKKQSLILNLQHSKGEALSPRISERQPPPITY